MISLRAAARRGQTYSVRVLPARPNQQRSPSTQYDERVLVIRAGITRTVILTRRHAIKVPSLRGGSVGKGRGRLQSLAWGLLANQSEAMWHSYDLWAGKVAPVRASLLGGLVNVYPRCEPLVAAGPGGSEVLLPTLDPCPRDIKPDNYGRLGGRVVRLDYDMR